MLPLHRAQPSLLLAITITLHPLSGELFDCCVVSPDNSTIVCSSFFFPPALPLLAIVYVVPHHPSPPLSPFPPSPVHCLIVVFFYCPRHCRRRHPSSVIIIMSPHPLSHPLFDVILLPLALSHPLLIVVLLLSPAVVRRSHCHHLPAPRCPPRLQALRLPCWLSCIRALVAESSSPPCRRVVGASRTRRTPPLA